MTRAVTEALRERLERIRHRCKAEATAEELLAIVRGCASTLKGPAVDHGTGSIARSEGRQKVTSIF
jgi:hypothetical protein